MIKDFKVWKGRATKSGREVRFYVHTTDGREGCYYKTGNPWHPAKSYEGDVTPEEWEVALKAATWDGKIHTVYENQMPTRLAAIGIGVKEQADTTSDTEKPQKEDKAAYRIRRNRYGQHCWKCGRWVPAETGELFFVNDDDEAMYGFQSGWLVQCLDDADECNRIVKSEREAAEAKREAAEAERKAWEEKLAKMTPEERKAFEEEQKKAREEFWNEFFERTQYLT